MNARVWWVCLAAALASARELDPAGCAARFDVQRDKIIRTEESRGLGARYLSELDVGARAECLRLCCETDTCDVFVFEEKSPGSCYLFNCGPPEDFRCKFTAHGNFSSGVLALSRRLAELQDRERLAHHERALASLRGPTTTTTTTVATTASTNTRSPRPPQPPPQTSRCSRYQFECRRGGECIAVYNACDGVPQCADGSDEAPELGCPVPPAPAPAPAATPPPPPPPPPPFARDEGGEEATELWPHRLTQAQAQVPRRYGVSAGTSAHIFSHAGGLVQESAFEPPAPDAPWPRRPWQQPRLPASDAAEPDRNGWSAYGRAEWADGEPRRAWPVPPRAEPEMPLYMPPKAMPELPMVYSSQQQTLRDSPKKGFELASKADYGTEPPAPPPARVQPHLARPDVEKPAPIESSTKKKVLQVITDDSSKVARTKPRADAPAQTAAGAGQAAALPMREHFAAEEHDGLSEHPPAAVLLLVLGTLMTAALGGLLACRARASRRRRHRPRMALDSDYLVNGMYL